MKVHLELNGEEFRLVEAYRRQRGILRPAAIRSMIRMAGESQHAEKVGYVEAVTGLQLLIDELGARIDQLQQTLKQQDADFDSLIAYWIESALSTRVLINEQSPRNWARIEEARNKVLRQIRKRSSPGSESP